VAINACQKFLSDTTDLNCRLIGSTLDSKPE
jgi:hypothetical protein